MNPRTRRLPQPLLFKFISTPKSLSVQAEIGAACHSNSEHKFTCRELSGPMQTKPSLDQCPWFLHQNSCQEGVHPPSLSFTDLPSPPLNPFFHPTQMVKLGIHSSNGNFDRETDDEPVDFMVVFLKPPEESNAGPTSKCFLHHLPDIFLCRQPTSVQRG